MIEIKFYSENFEGVSGKTLRKVLTKIKEFRKDFWLELRGNLEELDNFCKEDTVAFYTINDYGYLLGKFESMILPELEYHKPYNTSSIVDMMFISEIYVKPKYRKQTIANSMLRDLQLVARTKDLPIVLGCRKALIPFFKRFCFNSIENFKSKECAFMFWNFAPTTIERRFELLFKD